MSISLVGGFRLHIGMLEDNITPVAPNLSEVAVAARLISAWLLVTALLAAGCGGGGGHVDLAADGLGDALPSVDELTRGTSGLMHVSGEDYVRQHGGQVENTDLVLTYVPPELVGGGPTGPGPETHLAYAVYAIDGAAEQPLTLEVKVGYDNEAVYWLGFADWQGRTWNFSDGYHYGSVLTGIEDLPGGAERFVSPEGRVALAVVLLDENVPLRIHFVEVTTATEVQDLTASTDRWDGVHLTWEGDDNADGYHLYRRPTIIPDDAWEQVTDDPISGFAEEYLDTTALGGLEYEYRLSVGFWRLVQGLPRWFWSEGTTTIGKRHLSHLNVDLTAYWPANMYKYLAFFQTPTAAPQTISAQQTTSYPPGDGWIAYSEATEGFGGIELGSLEQFGSPFTLYQEEDLDNQTLCMLYSNSAGLFSHVATITPEGEAAWETPVTVREAGPHLLGVIRMPRRIGAVTWNQTLGRIELVDSIDMMGRDWYPFDPDGIAWHVVGERVPDGNLDLRYFGGGERITYRERDTGEIVCYEREGTWKDISPGIVCGPGPTSRVVINGFGLPGYAIIYLTPDGKRIKMLRQNNTGDWLTFEIVDLVIAKGESTISEFALLTSDEVSWQNYLAYVLDGELYVRYTEYASFASFDNPALVDDAPGIHDLRVIRLGSGENWTSLKFVTYLSDGPGGQQRLNFRDMDIARLPQ